MIQSKNTVIESVSYQFNPFYLKVANKLSKFLHRETELFSNTFTFLFKIQFSRSLTAMKLLATHNFKRTKLSLETG